ncbi:MAG TPA: lamin tail domain-containing protein, partial [Verrucomicrobiae bacterium]|nr:lamin tail domain-containing protein [Verrucomicrobiae bacterium]
MKWTGYILGLWLAGGSAYAQPDRVLISEFMAVNENGLKDEDRARSDWIELYNSGTQAVNLGGWYLTDNRDSLTKWRFPLTPLAPGKFLIVFASDKNRAVAGRELHTNFRLNDKGEYLGLVMPDGLTVVSEYSPAYPPQWPDVAYGLGAIQSVEPLILATSPAKLLIPTPMTPPEWIRPDYDDSAWLPVPASVGFGDVVVATNIAALMQNVNSSAYLRIPFQVGPLTNASGDVIENNSLRLEYDDAVIAYLNGQEILRDNAPDGATWNSVALSKKSGTLSRDQLPLLPGDNWLTIHGLNWGAGSSDFRVNPSLTLTRRGKRFGFLIGPTPGDVNAQSLFTPGPIISEATSFPTWPKPADAIQVTARVIPWQDPIDQVTLHYFGSVQVTIPMFDDGQHGDGFPGDGIYGATIPPGTGMPLEVLRWQIQATDLGGGNSQEPELRLSYPRQNRYRGYLGAVLAPPRPPSRLRTLYLNVTSNAVPLMNSGGGVPCAVSFDGQFYDNAWISLRGSSHDQKNSHRIDLTTAHAFSRLATEKPVTSFYLTSAFPDPSYLREYLCYWVLAAAGSPAPWHEPVAVWLNGSFYQLAFLSEEFGAAQIEHLGYDPTGDRFRETGTLRTNVNQGSLSALTAALAETLPLRTRRNALFDLVDIPQVINHLAVARFVQDNDDVVDNLSLYCDTHGDGRWRVIPFDMSTTWGLPDLSAFPVNDFGSGFPLYGSSVAPRVNGIKADFNRLYDALFLVAETRQMFLRRLRTLVETQATPRGSSRLERQIAAMKDLLSNDAALDHARWPWATVDSSQAIDALLSGFLYPRVTHLLEHHCVTNTALPLGITPGSNAGLPVAQPQDAAIALFDLQPTPASGVAAQEYLAFTNANDYAVDLSRWQIGGDIHFTFSPGTVLPAQRVLYVSPDTRAFRARSTAPRGGQGLFVIGNYDGQLSSRGGQITLTNAAGALITSRPYTHQPSPAQLNLRITEIHYHPRLPPLGPSPLEEDYAFLELMNVGLEPISLDGVRLTSGVSFAFTGSALTTLAPGERVVIVKNLPAFRARYGPEPRVAGQFIGTLDNHGEKIRLEDRVGESILEFTYHPNWHKSTDGPGFSLVVTDELAPPEEWNNPALWRASAHPGGSPGRPDDPPVPIPAIWINEILAHTTPPYTDAVELYNPNAFEVDIGGWYLTDNFAELDNFKFPRATIVPAHDYLAFDTTLFDSPLLPRAHRFSFGNDGDQVYLLSAGPDGEFTGFVDGFVFGATEPNQSLGRYRLSTGEEQLVPLQEMSFMLPNGPVRIGPVVITEAYYHPPEDANDDLLLENLDDEFIEVFNLSDQAVALGTNTITPQPWRLAKAIDYTFPAGFTLPSHSFAVVVRFDAQFQPVLAESFRNRFGMPAETPLLGPYLGRLSNQGERIELQKPSADSTNHVHYVTVDPVTYQPQLPWPARWVNGAGASLQRLDAGAYSDDPINWGEGPPTPGRSNSIVRYPVVLDSPTRHILAPGASVLLTVNAVRGDDPITIQWFRNGAAIPDATGRTLLLTNAATPDTGDYDVVVSDPDGRVTNRIASVTVLAPPSVIVPPQD